jgi:hypothetical protein
VASDHIISNEKMSSEDGITVRKSFQITSATKSTQSGRDGYRPHRVRHRPTLRHQHIDLPKLRNDLFRRMPLLALLRILLCQNNTSGRTASK